MSLLYLRLFVVQELRDEKKAHQITKTEKERTIRELEGVRVRIHEDYNKAVGKYNQLKAQHEAAALEADEAQDKLEEQVQEIRGRLEIREGTRGHPLGRSFVLHCRTLLATGGSARSIREQLLLNGHFFVAENDHSYFTEQMPELCWFQF
jgi:hypothetical protein